MIYSNKLSNLTIYLNKKSGGKVFERIAKMYDRIYIDEVQDMAGYDLEIFKQLIIAKIELIMVGDPRQYVYKTHNSLKYKKYSGGKINLFFEEECKELGVYIDTKTLNQTYRNNEIICNFANKLYHPSDFEPVISYRKVKDEDTEGVFQIDEKDIDNYLEKFNPVQLRWSKNKKVNDKYSVYNFGESKGLEFERVIIYPTDEIWNWIVDNAHELKDETRAKLYVAITRARDSVVIIRKGKKECNLPFVKI